MKTDRLNDTTKRRNRDDVLLEHFLAIVRGSGREFGPDAERDLRRILARGRATGNVASFAGYVIRLIQADAAANGWMAA